MSGFTRTKQPQPLTRAQAIAILQPRATEEIAAILAGQDVFGIDHDCLNPAGHDAIASCGDVVCPHCAKVFWR